MLVCAIGLLIGGFFAARPAHAVGSRIVILDSLDLPNHMLEAREKVRSAVESAALESGREVVGGSGSSWCTTAECFREAARAAGVTEVLAISGGRNEYEGWRLAIELRGQDGVARINRVGGCNVCSGREMVTVAAALAKSVLAQVAFSDLQSKPLAVPTPLAPAVLATVAPPALPTGARSSRSGKLTRDVAITGAGVVTLGVGGYLWWLNNRGTDCEAGTSGGTVCPAAYRTAKIGIPLTAAGAAIAVAGALLIAVDVRSRSTKVAIGPGTFALAGNF